MITIQLNNKESTHTSWTPDSAHDEIELMLRAVRLFPQQDGESAVTAVHHARRSFIAAVKHLRTLPQWSALYL